MRQISTGIEGLDLILTGGIIPGSSVLIEGAPGCGKTTLGIQTIVEGIQAGEAGLILSFEQFPEQIHRDARRFGWDLPRMEQENKLRLICTSPQVINDQLFQPSGPIYQLIDRLGVKRILIDSFTHFRRITAEETALRELLFSMMNSLKQRGLTVLLTKEYDTYQSVGFEEYLVDVIICLTYLETPSAIRRREIEVLKSRGHEHISGKHGFEFTPKGLQVFPPVDLFKSKREIPQGKLQTRVPGLDDLLGGGIPLGQNMLVCGSAGVGKTTLALQTMHNVLQDKDQTGFFYLYSESPAQIYQKAESFGWDLRRLTDQGQLTMQFADFARLDVDQQIYQMWEAMQRHKPTLVVVDTVPLFLHTVSYDEYKVTEKIAQLTKVIHQSGATSLLLSTSNLNSQQISRFGLEEAFCDGVIILDTEAIRSARKRNLEVYKLRDGKHVIGKYRMEIEEEGIRVLYIG